MKIKKSLPKDSKRLTELTIRSKSFWDYSPDQIEKCKDDLTVSEKYIAEKEVYQLTDAEEDVIGYYSYYKMDENSIKLENLFVEPKYIGCGYGKMLMNNFLERIRATNAQKVILDSDPNAENFYNKIGFELIGKLATSIEGRFLPIMELKIQPITKKSNRNTV